MRRLQLGSFPTMHFLPFGAGVMVASALGGAKTMRKRYLLMVLAFLLVFGVGAGGAEEDFGPAKLAKLNMSPASTELTADLNNFTPRFLSEELPDLLAAVVDNDLKRVKELLLSRYVGVNVTGDIVVNGTWKRGWTGSCTKQLV
mmetsp:Transcript_160922/g.516475  ORF Transcript_160922/g.516475 Transcript_160922/m.516475 type:complete len:144 (-) Transcript_160922:139-570(-)